MESEVMVDVQRFQTVDRLDADRGMDGVGAVDARLGGGARRDGKVMAMAATVARKVLNAMVAAEHDLVDGIRQREIKRMPQVMRLAHPKAIRHMSCIGIGWGLCLAGSWIAHHADTWPLVGHTWWDAIGYTVHAFGAIPIVGHGERLWALLRA